MTVGLSGGVVLSAIRAHDRVAIPHAEPRRCLACITALGQATTPHSSAPAYQDPTNAAERAPQAAVSTPPSRCSPRPFSANSSIPPTASTTTPTRAPTRTYASDDHSM